MLALRSPIPLLRTKRDVTLIVGLKCSDGFVVCSDSQETSGAHDEYRVDRKKLVVKTCGNFQIAAAGSGNNGKLIDSLTQRLHDNIAAASFLSIPELKKFIEQELLDFRKNEASDYSRADKDMAFIIAAHSIKQPGCAVWISAASRLTEVTDFALTGHEDYRYDYLLTNLYRDNLTLAQGMFLGLHLMGIAEQTSNCIKAPVTVVRVRPNGMREETQSVIDQLVLRVKLFSSQTDSMMLACADTGLQPSEFGRQLKEFIATITHFRKEYVEMSLGEKIEQGLETVNDDYTLIPAGTTINYNPTEQQAKQLREMQEQLVKTLREQENGQQDYARIISNLAAVKSCSEAETVHRAGGPAPNESVLQAAGTAIAELSQAHFMGPYKISEKASIALARFFGFFNAQFDLGFGQDENQRLRMMALDQCIAVIESEFNSQSQAPSPANPAQS